ncbi:hypothetical protein AB0C59_10045 [Streptomyces sp. NPDC048664]|uniref:hypothetical protein n=1 Tax=Streptomyces sp. NPDC048664 TaxID=3154505 RepID=UPI00343BECB0
MNLVVLFLTLGAICRVTRFITKDTLAAGLRIRVADRFGDDSRPTVLVTCGWCTSIWVSAAAVPLAHLVGTTTCFRVAATILTLSYLAGVASDRLD